MADWRQNLRFRRQSSYVPTTTCWSCSHQNFRSVALFEHLCKGFRTGLALFVLEWYYPSTSRPNVDDAEQEVDALVIMSDRRYVHQIALPNVILPVALDRP